MAQHKPRDRNATQKVPYAVTDPQTDAVITGEAAKKDVKLGDMLVVRPGRAQRRKQEREFRIASAAQQREAEARFSRFAAGLPLGAVVDEIEEDGDDANSPAE